MSTVLVGLAEVIAAPGASRAMSNRLPAAMERALGNIRNLSRRWVRPVRWRTNPLTIRLGSTAYGVGQIAPFRVTGFSTIWRRSGTPQYVRMRIELLAAAQRPPLAGR